MYIVLTTMITCSIVPATICTYIRVYIVISVSLNAILQTYYDTYMGKEQCSLVIDIHMYILIINKNQPINSIR